MNPKLCLIILCFLCVGDIIFAILKFNRTFHCDEEDLHISGPNYILAATILALGILNLVLALYIGRKRRLGHMSYMNEGLNNSNETS